jgi:hypothetical protein
VNLAVPGDEVHVHGYEIEKPTEHSPVTFSFPASLDGVFEVEVHRSDRPRANRNAPRESLMRAQD